MAPAADGPVLPDDFVAPLVEASSPVIEPMLQRVGYSVEEWKRNGGNRVLAARAAQRAAAAGPALQVV